MGGGGGGSNEKKEGEAGLDGDSLADLCGDGGCDGGGGGRTNDAGRMMVCLRGSECLWCASLRGYRTSVDLSPATDRGRLGRPSPSRTRSDIGGTSPLATVGSDEGIDGVLVHGDDRLSLLFDDFLRAFVLMGDFVEVDLPTINLCDARLPPRRDLAEDGCRRVEESGNVKVWGRE